MLLRNRGAAMRNLLGCPTGVHLLSQRFPFSFVVCVHMNRRKPPHLAADGLVTTTPPPPRICTPCGFEPCLSCTSHFLASPQHPIPLPSSQTPSQRSHTHSTTTLSARSCSVAYRPARASARSVAATRACIPRIAHRSSRNAAASHAWLPRTALHARARACRSRSCASARPACPTTTS